MKKKVFYFLCAIFTSFYVYQAIFGIIYPQLSRSVFVFFGVALVLLSKPMGKNYWANILDIFLILLAAASTFYFNLEYERLCEEAGKPIGNLDLFFGTALILLTIEALRRELGYSLTFLVLFFLFYLYLGPNFPSPFSHKGFDIRTIVSVMFSGTEGMFGEITHVLADQMFLFLVFGALLTVSGASSFYMDLCLALFGHRTGGGGKAAVTASFIVGTITGSASANVAITGVVTIPMMKRTGYQPHVAGATEAAASLGGSILPPVMGAAAFVMVALTGIPYVTIIQYASIPGVLYFLGVYFQTHFYALKMNLKGLPQEELPKLGPSLKRGWYHIAPFFSVVYLLLKGYSLPLVALSAIACTVFFSYMRRETRMSIKDIVNGLALGAKTSIPILAIAAPVSIMSEAVLLPGMGLKLSSMILDLSGGSVAVTIFIVFVVGYILGMGLSIVPAYIILATLGAPALIQLGVPVMAAHLMVMWYGQASTITPPVCLASYVAAGLAGSSFWKTGMEAVKKAMAIFYLPILFVYQPGLLLNGSLITILATVGSLIIGIFILSTGIERYLIRKCTLLEQILLLASGTVWILGTTLPYFIIGAGLFIIVWILQRRVKIQRR
jgi:TRAP transporter 4TM/12TM fusion protein